MLKGISFKLVITLGLLVVVVAPSAYFFREQLRSIFVTETTDDTSVEFILVDETPEYSIQANPFHSQDFQTHFLGYFFINDVKRVYLHLTTQPQAVKNSWPGEQGQSVTFSSHSSHFPANKELHVFVHLNRQALTDAGWSSQMISRHVEGLFYQAIFIVSSDITDEQKLAKQLLNQSELNLFLIGNE